MRLYAALHINACQDFMCPPLYRVHSYQMIVHTSTSTYRVRSLYDMLHKLISYDTVELGRPMATPPNPFLLPPFHHQVLRMNYSCTP